MKKAGHYLVGVYTRVSRDDGDNETSESILVQRILAESFCRNLEDLYLVKVYEDDGYTGTNFERPAFQQLLRDIHLGLINCVVVKDLSRLGRDYIGVGEYLEKQFPLLGVRFIAINDHIDSVREPYTMLMPLSNVFNAQYTKDISQKVRSAVLSKHQAGLFTGAFAPYGYKKSSENTNRLIPDVLTAPVVHRIYTLYASGIGKTRIACMLNSECIPCPLKIRRMNSSDGSTPEASASYYWNSLAISRILHNSVYIGELCQGKTQTVDVNGKKRVQPQEKLIVSRDVHEAIINKPLWESVHARLQENAKPKFEKTPGRENPLTGLIYCGQCGRKHKLSYMKGRRYYVCSLYKTAGPSACTSHGIYEDALTEAILADINTMISQVYDLNTLCREAVENPSMSQSAASLLQTQLANEDKRKQEAYEEYREGKLSKEDFHEAKMKHESRIQEITDRLAEINEEKGFCKSPWVKDLLGKQKLTRLDSSTSKAAVEKIIVHDREVEIWYSFAPKTQ